MKKRAPWFSEVVIPKDINLKPYYEENGITIYRGDCRDVLESFPSCFRVNAIITDPPYGIGFSEYASHVDTPEGYAEFIWPVCERLETFVDDGWMCVFQAAKRCRDWAGMFPREWRLIACPKTFVQIFSTALGPKYATDYALIWPIGSPSQKAKGRDWKVSNTSPNPSNRTGHPCSRPLEQMQYVVHCLTEDGESVLDPFMGSGTTLRAAKDLGRKAIGIEIEEKYCEIAANRLRQEVLAFA